MIPNDHAILLFKFGEYRWMQRIVDGELSFSCAGAFIHQAKLTKNDVQGDEYEGIFARVDKNDLRIGEMQKRLGTDLEILDDNDYVFMRRKSAKLRPIFCLYGYKAVDALSDGNVSQEGLTKIRHRFNDKMFSGFSSALAAKNVVSDSHRFTILTMQPKPFVDRIKIAIIEANKVYKMKAVDYEIMRQESFFIEPTDNYDELFCKAPQYEYQHEARICLNKDKFHHIFERLPLPMLPYTSKDENIDYWISHEPFYFDLDAIIEKRSNPKR